MSPRIRVTAFLGAITVLTGAVQWNGFSSLLDGLVGIPWSSGLVGLLKENTQGLIVFVLLGLFLEWSGLRQSAAERHNEFEIVQRLLGKALISSPARALLESGLDSLYGSDAARQLSNNLFRECSIFRNLTVKIVVTKEGDDFIVEVRLTYRTDAQRFLAAVASSPTHIEALLRTGLISEVFSVQNEIAGVPASVQRIDENVITGEKVVYDLQFQEISGNAKRSLFKGTSFNADNDKCRVYEAKSNKTRISNPADSCFYQVLYRHKQRMPYTFWMNDRVSQLESIDINLKALGPEVYKRAHLYRFLASAQWSAENSLETGSCLLQLNTWSVAGDGVVLAWSDGVHST